MQEYKCIKKIQYCIEKYVSGKDSATDARVVPIYQTTSYVFHNADHATQDLTQNKHEREKKNALKK